MNVTPLVSKAALNKYSEIYTHASDRQEYIKKHSWYILTKEVAHSLKEIMRNKSVVEVFAGTGYLAAQMRWLLKDQVKYRAYDNHSTHLTEKKINYGVTHKNAFNCNIKDADIVVMAWPEYNSNNALRIVKKMESGQTLIYQGESRGGCTGCYDFHYYLEDNFELDSEASDIINEGHVRWYGIYDHWHIYKKK